MGKRYSYTMGNAGDIIKHGLLAEFVEWWKDSNNKTLPLRVADTFGGHPWGENDKITSKLKDSECYALGRAYSEEDDKYLGSSHLIRQVAEKSKLKVSIDIFDRNKAVHRKLDEFKRKDSMKLIKLPYDDGYNILCDKKEPWKYNLILIDPYSEFLKGEFWDEGDPRYFTRIIELTEQYPNLFVAVFVLDDKEKEGERFDNFKRCKLSHCAFSLRCPKQGKSIFDTEILLIGQQIADGKCDKLRERLECFAPKASDVLLLPCDEKVKFWPGKQL